MEEALLRELTFFFSFLHRRGVAIKPLSSLLFRDV